MPSPTPSTAEGKSKASRKRLHESDEQDENVMPTVKRRGKAVPEDTFAPSAIETPRPSKMKTIGKNAASTQKIGRQKKADAADQHASEEQLAGLTPRLSKGAKGQKIKKSAIADAEVPEETSATADEIVQASNRAKATKIKKATRTVAEDQSAGVANTASKKKPFAASQKKKSAAAIEGATIADVAEQPDGVAKTASKKNWGCAKTQMSPTPSQISDEDGYAAVKRVLSKGACMAAHPAEELGSGWNVGKGKKFKKTSKKGKKAKKTTLKVKVAGVREDEGKKCRRMKRSSSLKNLSSTALAGDLDEIPEPEPFAELLKQQELFKWKGSFVQGMDAMSEQASF